MFVHLFANTHKKKKISNTCLNDTKSFSRVINVLNATFSLVTNRKKKKHNNNSIFLLNIYQHIHVPEILARITKCYRQTFSNKNSWVRDSKDVFGEDVFFNCCPNYPNRNFGSKQWNTDWISWYRKSLFLLVYLHKPWVQQTVTSLKGSNGAC